MARIHATVAIVKIHVVKEGRARFAEHSQLDLEVPLLLAQHFGLLHAETEKLRIARIILHQSHCLRQRGAWNKNCSNPVVHDSVGYPYGPVVVARFQTFRYNFAARQSFVELLAERLLLAVDPEKCAGFSRLCCSFFFRHSHVPIESLDGIRLKLGRPRKRCEQPEAKNPEGYRSSPIAPRFFQRIHAIHRFDFYPSRRMRWW